MDLISVFIIVLVAVCVGALLIWRINLAPIAGPSAATIKWALATLVILILLLVTLRAIGVYGGPPLVLFGRR